MRGGEVVDSYVNWFIACEKKRRTGVWSGVRRFDRFNEQVRSVGGPKINQWTAHTK